MNGIYVQNHQNSMEKIIFRNFLKDIIKFFLLCLISIGLIVWVIQAVNFLDFIAEDGHGLKTYFQYTLLSLPKIISRILPFVFFFSIFYIISKYENNNELLIFWNTGIKKITFVNVLLKMAFYFFIAQVLLTSFVVPFTQDKARSSIRKSNIDFLPALIKEKKFVDAIPNLTIFIDKKNKNNELENIYIKDKFGIFESQIIYAKRGIIKSVNNNNILYLIDGDFINIKKNKSTKFKFSSTEINLSKFTTVTTTYPKIQELGTHVLFNCLSFLKMGKNNFTNKYLRCNKNSEKMVAQEFLKRLYLPIFLPLLALIACLQILISKDNYKYYKNRSLNFFYGILILLISEISIRYAGKDTINSLIFILIPLILFFFFYIYLTSKIKVKI